MNPINPRVLDMFDQELYLGDTVIMSRSVVDPNGYRDLIEVEVVGFHHTQSMTATMLIVGSLVKLDEGEKRATTMICPKFTCKVNYE